MNRPTNETFLYTIAVVVLTIFLVVVGASIVSASHELGDTHDERPNYQRWDSPQNYWDNWVAFIEYSASLDAELGAAFQAGDKDHAQLLAGENYSASQEILSDLWQNDPSDSCSEQFDAAFTRLATAYTLSYAGFYFNITAEAGEEVDLSALIEFTSETETVARTSVPDDCFAGLDT